MKRLLSLLLTLTLLTLPLAAAEAEAFVPGLTITPTAQEAATLKRLDLAGSMGQLRVEEGDALRIEAGEKIANYVKVELVDGTLFVSCTLARNWLLPRNFRELDYRIVVTLPRDQRFESVKIVTASGGGHLVGLTTNTLAITCGSGDVTMRDFTVAKSCTLSLGSGRATLSKVTAGGLELQGGSGDAWLAEVALSGNLVADLGSGRMQLDTLAANAAALDTGSGEVVGKSLRLAGLLDLEAHSGDLELAGEFGGGLTYAGGSGHTVIDGLRGGVTASVSSGTLTLTLLGRRAEYDATVTVGSGEVLVDGARLPDGTNHNASRPHRLTLSVGSGAADVRFR